jgi:membrane-associated protein
LVLIVSVPDAEAGEAAKVTTSDPRVPWTGKPRRVDILCWAAITLSGVYYWAILPFRASLVGTHPVVLEVLNGATEAIVAGGSFARIGHGSIVVVLLAAIPGLMKFDLIYWWAGRLWGEKIILLLSGNHKRGPKYMARVQRWGRKFMWPAMLVCQFVPIPTAIVYVIAGWSGMRLTTFLILDAIGTLAWAGTLAGLGWEMGHRGVDIAEDISHYGLWISLGLVAVVVAFQIRSTRRMAAVAAAAQQAAQQPATTATAGAED